MIVYICDLNLETKIATCCKAASKDDVDNKRGKFFVQWFNESPPKIDLSYSMIPCLKWTDYGLTHGYIDSNKPIT